MFSFQGTELYSSDYYTKLSNQPRWCPTIHKRKISCSQEEDLLWRPWRTSEGIWHRPHEVDILFLTSLLKHVDCLRRLTAPSPPDGLIGVARALPSQMVSCHWLQTWNLSKKSPGTPWGLQRMNLKGASLTTLDNPNPPWIPGITRDRPETPPRTSWCKFITRWDVGVWLVEQCALWASSPRLGRLARVGSQGDQRLRQSKFTFWWQFKCKCMTQFLLEFVMIYMGLTMIENSV